LLLFSLFSTGALFAPHKFFLFFHRSSFLIGALFLLNNGLYSSNKTRKAFFIDNLLSISQSGGDAAPQQYIEQLENTTKFINKFRCFTSFFIKNIRKLARSQNRIKSRIRCKKFAGFGYGFGIRAGPDPAGFFWINPIRKKSGEREKTRIWDPDSGKSGRSPVRCRSLITPYFS